ncbi:threonine synthase [Sinorhizobium meliloti]|uniref:threonine synthase n=1 Tax=Rhizobium meliloti TaxID=382 RepID=UPI00299ED18E|nr:threonine synthase [Sinorhizobium meliloti]MDX0198737.1 threonine synthase [Sinorhizobium meliloti]MDX0235477.1 threonine synthase [Sinorhizobium meliloti]
MIKYVSTTGGIEPVGFDEAVLQGFAADGGLFVPDRIPVIDQEQLQAFSTLSFQDLAFELVSLYIDASIIPRQDLRRLIDNSYREFQRPDIVNLVPIRGNRDTYVLELFHGPTQSFKDMAMGFLMQVVDYLLGQRRERLNIVLATTGDTGPAAAWAAAGKQRIDCWPLYPRGMISREQERQMTTLRADNVHPVGVENCPDGGDDLDLVVAELFSDEKLKRTLALSSVNSINWCRVMTQTVHYFYSYYRAVERVGDPVVFSVPSGAFGNLFAGYLARSMGLPVARFVCANNVNNALHTAFSRGVLPRHDLVQTPSSAIDIVAPYNFWRLLYFATNRDTARIRQWMKDFAARREVVLDVETTKTIQGGFISASISDEETLATVRSVYEAEGHYLIDPHTAVAVAAVEAIRDSLPAAAAIVCFATAHPAKFPDVIKRALDVEELPAAGHHPVIDEARDACEHLRICQLENLRSNLIGEMTRHVARRRG